MGVFFHPCCAASKSSICHLRLHKSIHNIYIYISIYIMLEFNHISYLRIPWIPNSLICWYVFIIVAWVSQQNCPGGTLCFWTSATSSASPAAARSPSRPLRRSRRAPPRRRGHRRRRWRLAADRSRRAPGWCHLDGMRLWRLKNYWNNWNADNLCCIT